MVLFYSYVKLPEGTLDVKKHVFFDPAGSGALVAFARSELSEQRGVDQLFLHGEAKSKSRFRSQEVPAYICIYI